MFQILFKTDFASLILRLTLASIFITQGWLKITRFEWGTAWFYEHMEFMPAGLQAAVAWGELICGVALVLGLLTRFAALGLVAIMIGAIYKVTWRLEFTNLVVEGPRGFIVHEVGYEYNYAVIAMCVTLIILGAGALSIDHLLWPAKPTQVGPLSGAPQTSSVT